MTFTFHPEIIQNRGVILSAAKNPKAYSIGFYQKFSLRPRILRCAQNDTAILGYFGVKG